MTRGASVRREGSDGVQGGWQRPRGVQRRAGRSTRWPATGMEAAARGGKAAASTRSGANGDGRGSTTTSRARGGAHVEAQRRQGRATCGHGKREGRRRARRHDGDVASEVRPP